MRACSFIFILAFFILEVYQVAALDLLWLDEAMVWSIDQTQAERERLENEIKTKGENSERLAKLGICLHNLSNEGGEKGAGQALRTLERSLELKSDPIVKAFMGSSLTLLAGERTSLGDLGAGLQLIDEAIEESQGDPIVLFIRLSNGASSDIPYFSFSTRREILLEDITKLETLFENSEIDEDMFASTLFLKANIAIRDEDLDQAIKIWEEILNNYPYSKIASSAEENLLIYGEE